MKRSGALLIVLLTARAISAAHAVTLDAALAQTLENNPRILQAKTALEEAAGARLILRSLSRSRRARFTCSTWLMLILSRG